MNARVLVLFSLLLLTIPSASAAAPANVRLCDPSSDCSSSLIFALYSASGGTCYLSFASGSAGGYFDGAAVSGKYVNFTNIALGSPTNPAQSFGAGCSGGNVTLAAIASDHVEFSEGSTPTSVNPEVFFYSNTAVDTVIYTQSGVQTVINSDQFATQLPFICSAPPCVFENATNSTYILSANGTLPFSVDWYYTAFDDSGASHGGQAATPGSSVQRGLASIIPGWSLLQASDLLVMFIAAAILSAVSMRAYQDEYVLAARQLGPSRHTSR